MEGKEMAKVKHVVCETQQERELRSLINEHLRRGNMQVCTELKGILNAMVRGEFEECALEDAGNA